MVALIPAFFFWVLSGEVVFAQSCDSSGASPALDQNGLLPPKHNPASVPPADKPNTTDPMKLVPSVPMTSETCAAIRLFDASAESERHYDLVNCLDGLTFGFGNWPQGELGKFFQELNKDSNAEKALVARFVEVFKANPDAWSFFKKDAGLGDTVDSGTVRTGIKNLLASAKIKNAKGLKNRFSDGACEMRPENGKSFYFDHAKWLVPTLQYAFRDPAVVAFQVNHWETDVLSKAKDHAELLGLPKEGVFLMAFYESNPGQVPSLKTAISDKKPPETLRAGGRNWKWDGSDRPSALAGITLDRWHTLLIWQAMCPAPGEKFRIRNRNLKFFSEYLAADFRVPAETQPRMPRANYPKNCDPAQVKLR
jgi:hypothetical protein